MTAREAVEAELTMLRVEPIAPGIVAIALALADQLDEAFNGTSAANVARELRATMLELRKVAPLQADNDQLDELTKQREARRRRSGTAG